MMKEKENEELENFKEELQKNQKKNLHFMFFQKDSRISSIKVPIINIETPGEILNPYRNMKCTKPSCIYNFKELLSQYQICQKKRNSNFICHKCQQVINISSFFCDTTLKFLIEKIWSKYNKPDQVVCSEVKIYRDGRCTPLISEYLKQMQRNFIEDFGTDKEKNNKFLKDLDENFFRVPPVKETNDGALKFTLKYGVFPKLSEYSKEEYSKLELGLKGMKMNALVLERYGNPIFVKDFVSFKDDSGFPVNIMTVFLLYLQDLQKNNPALYQPEKMNRGLFLGFKISKYDSFYKNLKYDLFFGMKNIYQGKPRLIYSNFDLVFMVIYLEDRYFLGVVQLQTQTLHIVNFLDRDLDPNQEENYYSEILNIITQKELGLKSLKINLYEKNKFNFYNDYGIFIALFIFKLIKHPSIENLRFKTSKKESFKKCLLWLILKLSTQTPEKVYYYDFKGENDEPEAHEYRPAKPVKPKEKRKKVHRPRKSSLLSVSTPVESESKLSFESKGYNWDLEENRRMSKIHELSQISEIQPNEESFFNIKNRKKEAPEQKNFFTVGLQRKPSIDEKPLNLPRIKSVSQQPKNDFYPEPPNKKNQKYFGREKEIFQKEKKEKEEEDVWKDPNKDKAIFKEFVEDRSFLSGDDDELVLEKETLVKILKDYKGKVKEKIIQKQGKENKEHKIIDEDDVRIKEKEIILSKNQLRELLEKHEEYVKNNYNENRQRENDLLMQQKLEEMSGDENNILENSSNKKMKQKKKKKEKESEGEEEESEEQDKKKKNKKKKNK